MCGIVCFYGRSRGISHVLDALELLAYRSPDSSGVAVLDADNNLAIRRAVGTSDQLRKKIADQPLPELRTGAVEVVVGHGRWAMVGAVTEENAHPLADRGRDRVACENGSHNATLMLGALLEQQKWWRGRGVPENEAIHRSDNTTEVMVYEWERARYQLDEESLGQDEKTFVTRLAGWGVSDPEEQALRLAAGRLREGNAHACAFYSRRRPETLYVTSHHKPIAIASRQLEDGSREVMVASDVNAALMLWSKEEVAAAAGQIQSLQQAAREGTMSVADAQKEIAGILHAFTVDVIFLDNELYQGEKLFARINNAGCHGQVLPEIQVSRYDGTPVPVMPQPLQLNPAMVGKGGYASYTENHIDEIPDVMDRLVYHYVDGRSPRMESTWQDGKIIGPGLNKEALGERFGPGLARLNRLLLVGEGSSWRDAQAAAPLFRQLLPGVVVNVYRPVEVLNLGQAIDPAGDLAIEISWSGTTDSLLKVDNWLGESGVLRLAITGRPQSDLGRRTARSGGTLDVFTGVEVSVATVKGYQAILMTLDLLALYLAGQRQDGTDAGDLARLIDELAFVIPRHVRALIHDDQRRQRIRRVARRCRLFNKVIVLGDSPADIEAELKIEELAQVVARASDFHAASIRPLIEHTALVDDERRKILFVINATSAGAHQEAGFVLNYLRELGVFCLVHTTPHERLEAWQKLPNAEVFVSPQVSRSLQPLIDAPFFFDLAVALAYARELSPEDVDRPRNLAKSVTVTGAEPRSDVEARREFQATSMAEFGAGQEAGAAWDEARARPSRAALRATVALRAALAVIAEPLPPQLPLDGIEHLIIMADSEAGENGIRMAGAAWLELLGIDLVAYRRFISELPQEQPGTAVLRLIQAGAVLAVRDNQTVALPADLAPLQLELLSAVYLTGLAVRLAHSRGVDTTLWETGLARLPLMTAGILADRNLGQRVREILAPYVSRGYDKVQIIGGGQDHASAISMARSLRAQGFMAEALYTDSAWHGPLATVGGPGAEHDTLIAILATDPLFQAAALVDTQVYRTRNAQVLLVVPQGNADLPAVRGVQATAVLSVPSVPRSFTPIINAAFGALFAGQMAQLWEEQGE